eukprot:TRINITY_DN5823_c0_g1_i1.p1 TRINITY_DN5823_c0_g1~~TRINITY_DN5823_c0_g1_i1.p1  ORF type:complete len:202 (-),score=6.24 TRINITY_DN5823_c0_g1_i1:635-1240(-)
MDLHFEDLPAVIIDCGSGSIKAGFAGDEAPSVECTSVIGRPKFKNRVVRRGVGDVDAYVGNEAQSKRGILILSYPMEHGIITNWEDMEKLWQHSYDQLRIGAEQRPTILTEPSLNAKRNREGMTERLFEHFGAPAMYIAAQPILTAYFSGRHSCLSVECGDGNILVFPVLGGYTIKEAIFRINLGGRDVTEYLAKLLQGRG